MTSLLSLLLVLLAVAYLASPSQVHHGLTDHETAAAPQWIHNRLSYMRYISAAGLG